MDHGDMSRGKIEIWDKDGKLDGLRVQTIAELKRMEAGTSLNAPVFVYLLTEM